MKCLLCASDSSPSYTKQDKERGEIVYFHCRGACGMIFLDPKQRLSAEEEKERYDLHNNDPEDVGYINFLQRLTKELVPQLPGNATGLDFGCGPGPAMQTILEPDGFTVENYDPFYYPDEALLQKQYDFITATEVFEHLFDPLAVLKQLDPLIREGGFLGVMTERLDPQILTPDEFAQWWYPTDPTHVCFYSNQTFEWIAKEFGWELQTPRKNVFILKKTSPSA